MPAAGKKSVYYIYSTSQQKYLDGGKGEGAEQRSYLRAYDGSAHGADGGSLESMQWRLGKLGSNLFYFLNVRHRKYLDAPFLAHCYASVGLWRRDNLSVLGRRPERRLWLIENVPGAPDPFYIR